MRAALQTVGHTGMKLFLLEHPQGCQMNVLGVFHAYFVPKSLGLKGKECIFIKVISCAVVLCVKILTPAIEV